MLIEFVFGKIENTSRNRESDVAKVSAFSYHVLTRYHAIKLSSN